MSGIAPQGEGRADGGKGRDAMAGYRTKVGTLFEVAVSVIALDDLLVAIFVQYRVALVW